jgi:ubiquitin carboxyl-terminal hydrolase 34
VEIAPFETKTKDLWEWKASLKIGDHVDANDKSVWNKSTILDIKENQLGPDRTIKMAYIGYRVYTETGNKSDEKGTFEGWSAKFDEWIPIYNPRIMPFYSKTQKGTSDDHDLDEDLDNLLQPEEGFTRVYAVPRIRKCISSVFMHLINLFGNLGGFDLVLNFIQKATQPAQESSEEQKEKESEGFDLNILASLVECISTCYLVYHKEFIQEYGHKFVEVCTRALKDSPEKSLRNVRREKIENIIKSIDKFQRRLITKDEREKQTEVLKLDIALLCLRSSYMERRIQGLRDLNNIIKNMRMFSTNKAFTPQFLIEWME